jgi:GNAT superfamily N-acetyltransferase
MMDSLDCEIRAPHPAEKRACRMLLPRATAPEQPSRLLVAVNGQPQRVVAAVAYGPDRLHTPGRWLVDLHVIAPLRRRGIGTSLLDRVIERAAANAVSSLRAWDWMPAESESAHGWTRLGFHVDQRREDYEVRLRDACDAIAPLLARVRPRIPPEARIVPLAEANLEAVVLLHQQYLGGNRHVLWPLLSGSVPNGYDRQLSCVLMLGDRVVGAVLGRVFSDGTCEADAKVLHPSVRRRWANIWLMHHAIAGALAHGTRILRYFTLDAHQDTRQLSERFGGVVTGCQVRMEREIAPPRAAEQRPAGEDAAGE